MPEKPHDGGPAFPPGAALIEASKAQDQELAEACMGMSYRQWLIGHALAGILANPRAFDQRHKPDEVAEGACNEADAILRRLAEGK